jgi:flagellar basal-body rod protein FlgB
MDFGQLPLFRLIARRMDFLNSRQQLLAQNIANTDTPGFVPKDLKQQTFGQLVTAGVSALDVAKTDPAHIALKKDGQRFEVRTVASTDGTLSGNGVELQKEMMKVAETSMEYQLASNVYKKQLNLFRLVLGRPGGAA